MKTSIGFSEAHLEKGTLPDKDFRSDVSSIKKRAEHDFVRALVKFHHRHVKKLTVKLKTRAS